MKKNTTLVSGTLTLAEEYFSLGCKFEKGFKTQQPNLKIAFEYYKKAADLKYRDAQYTVGLFYFLGKGVDRDIKQAANYYHLAADQGDANSQHNFAVCCEKGLGVEQNDEMAAKYYKLSADQKNSVSVESYAICLFNGKGVTQDVKAAFKLFQSIKDPTSFTQFNLGLCYEEGKGVAKNIPKAIQCYEKAAAAGIPEAELNLACIYLSNFADEKPELQKKGRELLENAAKKGELKAKHIIAMSYENGTHGFPKSPKQAVILFKEAAEAGHAKSAYYYATHLLNGEGVTRDDKLACKFLEQAANKGSGGARHQLALLILEGRGTEKDVKKAIALLKQTSDDGITASQFELGRLFFEGKVVEKDEAKALELLKKSAANGYAGSLQFLNDHFENLKPADAKQFITLLQQQAEEKDNPEAQIVLADDYARGQGVLRDEKKAFALYQKAAQHKNPVAWRELAICYHAGKLVDKDEKLARINFQLAAEKGDARAQFHLAYFYANGVGGVKQNFPLAQSWLERSAKQDFPDAMVAVGTYYETGRGGTLDKGKAKDLYENALALGDIEAAYRLTLFNLESEEKDFKTNQENALIYLKQAALQKHEEAQVLLAELFPAETMPRDNSLLLNLANCYILGKGVKKDRKKAVEILKLAALQNSAEAAYQLGLLYTAGVVVSIEQTAAKNYLKQAVALNHPAAQVLLDEVYGTEKEQKNSRILFNFANCLSDGTGVEKDEKRAVHYYEKAAKLGEVDAMHNLACCYANGNGVEKDDKKALTHFQQAADKGDADSLYSLGVFFETGRGGILKDESKALDYYQQAAAKDQVKAMQCLGDFYINGSAIIPQDEAKALQYYERAAVKQYPPAELSLAIYYHSKKDWQNARKWYEQAAAHGNAEAQSNLGIFCADGIAGDKDLPRALQLFEQAAAKGCDEAKFNREKCLKKMQKSSIETLDSEAKNGPPKTLCESVRVLFSGPLSASNSRLPGVLSPVDVTKTNWRSNKLSPR